MDQDPGTGRPIEIRGQPLARPAQDVGGLAQPEDRQQRHGAHLVPACDRCVEQPGHDPAAQRPEDDRSAEGQAAGWPDRVIEAV